VTAEPEAPHAAVRVAVLTVSSSRAARGGPDESGDRLASFARELGGEVAAREILSDDRALIEERLRHYSDVEPCELVLTTGGTGVAPRDLTPEATRAVIDREVPGIADAMREASRAHTKHWLLSRGVAGIRGATLIINFPGNPRSIEQTAAAIAGSLPHALALIAGDPSEH
jgi:molybdopterin adenylyltransferase